MFCNAYGIRSLYLIYFTFALAFNHFTEKTLSDEELKIYRRNVSKIKKKILGNKDECNSEYDALKKELREGIFKDLNMENKYTT